tara:strand:+ start:940 stop:2070 length:1131 start_codon:yes stop_codon:yes gene_type:complete
MTIPYIDYRKITSKKQLKDYIKEIDNGLLIYGEPKHTPSPINKEDALMVVFDETKFKYYITPLGDKYRLNEKNEKILVSENKGRSYQIKLANGELKIFRVHHLQLWSYYPHLDWKTFCENIQRQKKNGNATVDHILQDKNNKVCHYKYLEAVPIGENVRRNNINNEKKKRFVPSKEFIDLPNELWKTLEECCQKDEIINRYNTIKKGNPPRAISDKGRIKNNKGKISYGSPDGLHSCNNGIYVHVLVWLAFSDTEIEDKIILHADKHPSNTFNENGKVICYSNWFETLSLGTRKDNMKELSRDMERRAELDPKNEFIVFDKEENEVMRSHFVPRCFENLNKEYPEIEFHQRCIRGCLKKERNTHSGFTFKYVIPRT